MNRLLSILALAGLLFGAPAQANPAGDRVRLVYAFTPAAKAILGSDSSTRSWITAQTGTASATSYTFSGGDTRYQVATNSNGEIVFAIVSGVTPGDSQNGNAVGLAAQSIAVAELRDRLDADVVVVVTAASGDSNHSSLMDCTKTGAAAAAKAFVGVDIYGTGGTGTEVEMRIMAALGKAQCAGEDDAHAFMEGASANQCTLFRTLLSQSTGVQADMWVVPEGGLAGISGASGAGQDAANSKMAAKCPSYASGGVYSYTCQATGTCTTTPGFLTCTHNRTQTDSRGLPTCQPGSSDQGSTPVGCIKIETNLQSTWSQVNFTCTGGGGTSTSVNLGLLSNPAQSYLGMPLGTSLKNAVGKMNARFTEAKAYYQTKLAPRLKEAAGITGGK